MPEKPKRRKNKNKRKNNKSFNTDVNKNNIEGSEILDGSCSSSGVTENEVNATEFEDEKLETDLSQTGNNNDVVQSDIVPTEQFTNTDKDISSTSQVIENSHSEIVINNSDIKLSAEIPKEVAETSNKVLVLDDISIDTRIIEKDDDDRSVLPEESSKQCLSNVNAVNEPAEAVLQTYIVETPEQVTTTKNKSKLDNNKKSKSCDNDDCTTIVEVTDDTNIQSDDQNLVTNHTNILISNEESDIEWENVHHFNLPQTQPVQGVLSSDTISLNIVHCDEIKSLSPQEEQSLRNYLQTLNLATSSSNPNVGDIKTEIEQIINREIKYRLRKKGLTEDISLIRAGPSRSLAVIDEEGSGDSSKTSRRHSYLSDKKSDTEELEDEVFECKPTRSLKCSNINAIINNSNRRLIPQPCIRVDAKLKEPEISEARGDWSVQTVEKMTGVELVYLTDSSSSTSSIYDLNDEVDKGDETDVSVRMITPTIEVTDTESLLSKTFLSNNNDQNDKTSSEKDEEAAKSTKITDNVNDNFFNLTDQHDSHEIVILSTDNIKTNLIVKDVNESKSTANSKEIYQGTKSEDETEKFIENSLGPQKDIDTYALEIKVLKCELNNAINNLIKEVISDSESSKETSRDTIIRQDSSSSLDSSQCTAKYNPTHASLNDVANILQEDTNDNTKEETLQTDTGSSHVKDVLQNVSVKPLPTNKQIEFECCKQPSKLRDLCVNRISSFPFGDKILEELAQVSLRLQNMSVLASERNRENSTNKKSQKGTDIHEITKLIKCETSHNEHIPPPILPRKSSLKIAQDDTIKFMPPKTEVRYECLSPSQKMLMEKTNTIIERDFKSQPNLNISETKYRNDNLYKSSNIQSHIAPMKSETGSRLLALLKDTSISKTLNTQTLQDRDNQKPQQKIQSENFTKRLLDEIDSTNQYKETIIDKKSTTTISSVNSFKPLPPPKPKKLSTYFYESDEGSNFRGNSFRSMSSNKKYFHYSTGNLNKEIEDDISSIQNMHRYCTNLRDSSYNSSPRRPSLPKDLCDQQMEYIRQKEKEVDAELRRLEQEQYKTRNRGPRAPMVSEDKSNFNFNQTFKSLSKIDINKDFMSPSQRNKNIGNSKLSSVFSSSQEELLREKMYSEYVNQMAEREQRKQQRVIKVTQTPGKNSSIISKSMPLLENFDSRMNNPIEQEFISKARERWCKLGIRDPESEDKDDSDVYREPKVIEHKIKVIEAGEEKDVQNLPSHMQEFVRFTVKDKEQDIGSTGESKAENASTHVVVFCAVIILVLTVGKFLLQLLRKK